MTKRKILALNVLAFYGIGVLCGCSHHSEATNAPTQTANQVAAPNEIPKALPVADRSMLPK